MSQKVRLLLLPAEAAGRIQGLVHLPCSQSPPTSGGTMWGILHPSSWHTGQASPHQDITIVDLQQHPEQPAGQVTSPPAVGERERGVLVTSPPGVGERERGVLVVVCGGDQ